MWGNIQIDSSTAYTVHWPPDKRFAAAQAKLSVKNKIVTNHIG
jgi:hypothetical protein